MNYGDVMPVNLLVSKKTKKVKKLSVRSAKMGLGKDTQKSRKLNRKKLEKQLDKEWSLHVRTRDQICQKCGGRGSISPHHAFGRRHLATRWDIFNGVSLCYPCHIHWAHRDPAGFSVWFNRFVGNDQFQRLAECHNQVVKHTDEELQSMLDWFKKEQK